MFENLCDFIKSELSEIDRKAKSGKVSSAELEYADTLAHLKKNLLKSEEMMEEFDEGYSSEMRPVDGTMRGGSYRGGSYRYDGGMTYARGRGSRAKRDSMGRYSSERGYSMDGMEMADQLRDLMKDAPDESVRRDIERLLRKVEQM